MTRGSCRPLVRLRLVANERLELAALAPRVARADDFCVAGRSYSVTMGTPDRERRDRARGTCATDDRSRASAGGS
jgi:hypothetical protein